MRPRRHPGLVRTTLGIALPLLVIWATGFYILFRATQLDNESTVRAWLVGLILVGCSTLIALQIRRHVDEARLAHLERIAANEEWECSVEDGVNAVVTALRNVPQARPRSLNRRDARP